MRGTDTSPVSSAQRGSYPHDTVVRTMASNSGRYAASKGQLMNTHRSRGGLLRALMGASDRDVIIVALSSATDGCARDGRGGRPGAVGGMHLGGVKAAEEGRASGTRVACHDEHGELRFVPLPF